MIASHISSEFDEMLDRALGLQLQMAARVQRQVEDAIACLQSGSMPLIDQVLRHELVINQLERNVDALLGQIIARRTPAAADLRLLLALVKTTTDLERIGDEAKKIALRARSLTERAARAPLGEVGEMARLARTLVDEAVTALDKMDTSRLGEAADYEERLDASLRAALRVLITHMIEDPRGISTCLDMVFVAKSFERIGDHATNVLEHVVYAVQGRELRHAWPFSG